MTQELRSIVVDVRGAAVHALTCGSGQPLVLLHGLGGLAEEILGPFLFLARRYRLIAIDRPGYGRSAPLAQEPMTAERQAAWLAEALDALGLDRVVLLAHSIAAAPALWFAQSNPERVAGLVLVAPFCRPTRPAFMPALRLAAAPGIGRPVRALLRAAAPAIARHKLAQAFGRRSVPPHVATLPFRTMAQPSAILAMAHELRCYNTTATRLALRLKRIETRTVIVAGSRDDVAPWLQHAGWLARRLPNSAGICLRNVGHLPHHLRPRTVAAAVESAWRGSGKTDLRVV